MVGRKVELNWWMVGDLQCVENKFVNVGHACYSYYDAGPAYYACLQPDRRCFYLVRFVRAIRRISNGVAAPLSQRWSGMAHGPANL